MHQRRGLQGIAGAYFAPAEAGYLPQFSVNQRDQARVRGLIAAHPRVQQFGDLLRLGGLHAR